MYMDASRAHKQTSLFGKLLHNIAAFVSDSAVWEMVVIWCTAMGGHIGMHGKIGTNLQC